MGVLKVFGHGAGNSGPVKWVDFFKIFLYFKKLF
jgi:hypothetical protein